MDNRSRKVAILGTTPSRSLAPINDESWEIWTIGPGGKDHHRWDRLFEVHRTWPENFKDYLNDLSQVKSPQSVYTLLPMKEAMVGWAHGHGKDDKWLKETIQGKWSSNVVIDREKFFRKYRRRWFSSSISYCIALAIEEGVEEFGLWGIDLESGEEYISQFEGCDTLLWLARERGIKVHLPDGCGLDRDISPYPDRFETHMALTLEKKHDYLVQLLNQNRPQLEAVKVETFRTEGKLVAIRDIKALPFPFHEDFRKWADSFESETQNHLNGMSQELKKAQSAVDHLEGEKGAIQYLRRMYVWGVTDPDE